MATSIRQTIGVCWCVIVRFDSLNCVQIAPSGSIIIVTSRFALSDARAIGDELRFGGT
jgi:hypothetical protein